MRLWKKKKKTDKKYYIRPVQWRFYFLHVEIFCFFFSCKLENSGDNGSSKLPLFLRWGKKEFASAFVLNIQIHKHKYNTNLEDNDLWFIFNASCIKSPF